MAKRPPSKPGPFPPVFGPSFLRKFVAKTQQFWEIPKRRGIPANRTRPEKKTKYKKTTKKSKK